MPHPPHANQKALRAGRITELRHGITSLMMAANKGDMSHLLRLLGEGTDVNKEDNFGNTALTYAVLGGHADIVQTLLLSDADVYVRNRIGVDLLTLARRRNHARIAKLLKDAGAVEGTVPPGRTLRGPSEA